VKGLTTIMLRADCFMTCDIAVKLSVMGKGDMIDPGFRFSFQDQIHRLFKDFQKPHLQYPRSTALTPNSIFISTSTQV